MFLSRLCTCAWVPLVGRILIGGMFAMAGIQKLLALDGTAEMIASVNLPAASILALIVALFELGAGAMLIFGYRTHQAASWLAAFTIIATALFHTDLSDQIQTALFTKNLAIIGGLLAFSYFGAGKYAMDRPRH